MCHKPPFLFEILLPPSDLQSSVPLLTDHHRPFVTIMPEAGRLNVGASCSWFFATRPVQSCFFATRPGRRSFVADLNHKGREPSRSEKRSIEDLGGAGIGSAIIRF
ncbi:uncharacterized protein DS421_14g466720 [Arachis hypogaea]|nr:uncharacterized protein DS421_14g466720 [Arachis hypogaea]